MNREARLPDGKTPGGVIHTYLGYDPKTFPSPTAPPPDVAGAAFDHMLMFGSMDDFTPEQLAQAIQLDPSMFPQLGPSIGSIEAMLRERKAKILATFDPAPAAKSAQSALASEQGVAQPPDDQRAAFDRAVKRKSITDVENLWYRQKDESSDFARSLLRLRDRLGDVYQLDQLTSKYAFTGRTPLSVPEALDVKEELETIDRLLEQLKEARQNARLAIIDMEELSEYLDTSEMENLNQLREQIEDYLREEARRQGLDQAGKAYTLSPHSYRLFQRRLLQEIFSELDAARSGRHTGDIVGEGPIETHRTKAYEFGDPVASIDFTQSIANAASRWGATPAGDRSVRLDDVEIHRTRNSPRCATAVLMDMSGSMRHGQQYVHCKRMALALDGLIRSEYPGDFLAFFEMFTLARRIAPSDIPALMPKPVTIHRPTVRLKADMQNPNVSELQLPQHFTNIQHSLKLARQILAPQDTPNRQVILITDGLPTAHFEASELYMIYPPHARTEAATLREAMACAKENITINIFLLPSWSQTSEDIQFAHRIAESTRGRVFFTGGKDLDRFVLWDYVSQRRKIIG
jgi:uncharacterized protein with von Willebrand factor type A (vWA) domain